MDKSHVTLMASELSLAYGAQTVIRNISLSLRPGEVTALIGPNGAGKSTLLRLLAHLESAHAGTVTIKDLGDIASLSAIDRARLIGWLGERGSLPFAFRVLDTVRLGRYGWHQGTPSAGDDKVALSALEQMGIGHLADRDVTSLSSGEQQKTLIARLLAGQTPILFLDEPLTHLDINSSLSFLSLLKKMASAGATVCIAIHDLSLAYRFADRVICLSQGVLADQGPAQEILTSDVVEQIFRVKPSIAPGLVLTVENPSL